VARNAFALALLTALTLGGCSKLPWNKEAREAQETEAKLTALRARTDSLRKARRVADSLAQVRYTACADSVRIEMNKPPALKAKKKKGRKQPAFAKPSEELILTRVQAACVTESSGPQKTIATADSAKGKTAAVDSAKPIPATPAAAAPGPSETPAAAAPVAATPVSSAPVAAVQPAGDTVSADSAGKAKELEMYRETFAYSGAARDPFNSLLNMAKAGPELADLQLVGIYQNLRAPSASLAVFREKDGGKRHKLRAGDQVGRSRLVQIRERDVVFMIEDFGFERQETLSLRKQEDVTP
jgi:hypothetical protein